MHHCTQATGAMQGRRTGLRDYRRSWQHVAPWLKEADLAIGNLETSIGDEEVRCYPRFLAPETYLDALKDAGIDAVSLANNHAMDHGSEGLSRTLGKLQERGIISTGTTQDGAVVTLRARGLSIAVVSYTTFSNLRCSKSPCVRMARGPQGIQRLLSSVREAARTHDIVVVLLHWMSQYQIHPNRVEKGLADKLFEAGATTVIGGHPHVMADSAWRLQGAGRFSAARFVRYSLGNFLAGMKRFPSKLGAIDRVCFAPGVGGGYEVVAVDTIPTFIRRSAGRSGRYAHEVVPLLDLQHQCRTSSGPFSELAGAECREVAEHVAYWKSHREFYSSAMGEVLASGTTPAWRKPQP